MGGQLGGQLGGHFFAEKILMGGQMGGQNSLKNKVEFWRIVGFYKLSRRFLG